jgi:hypothetical protein
MIFFIIISIIAFFSYQKNDSFTIGGENCVLKTEIISPKGYAINSIRIIDFYGSIKPLLFVNDNIGYAFAKEYDGGYVNELKSVDGEKTWTDINFAYHF